MKINLLPTICLILLSLSSCQRNSQNATVTVDTVETDFFQGLDDANAEKIYEGTLPCADCNGILTNLKINNDSLTYFLTETYQGVVGKDSVFLRSGTFRNITGIDTTTNILELSAAKEAPVLLFRVLGDTALQKLEQNGRPIESDLNYILRKL